MDKKEPKRPEKGQKKGKDKPGRQPTAPSPDLVMMTKNSGAHYWLIDTRPTNGFYHARCKKCGVEKDFPYMEPKRERLVTSESEKPSPPCVIEPPKRARGRPRKVGV